MVAAKASASNLFYSDAAFEKLPMREAEVFLLRSIPLHVPTAQLLQELIVETPWRAEEITVWGKKHLQPRLTAWYGDAGRGYTYSGISMAPLPWTSTLAELRRFVESSCRETFNRNNRGQTPIKFKQPI